MSQQLNCLGLVCPEPVIRCRSLLASEQPDTFSVLVDNSAAVENVSRFLGKNGYTVAVEQRSDAEWALEAVRREGDRTADETGPAEPGQSTQSGQSTLSGLFGQFSHSRVGRSVVLITTETLGRGDDVLGRALMGNFLTTLPEMGDQLWRVVLLNGGVRLACEEGKPLEALKALVKQGVSLYVCGTCLTHYGLMDTKKVGETTNMLDIVTSLAEADKVIRP